MCKQTLKYGKQTDGHLVSCFTGPYSGQTTAAEVTWSLAGAQSIRALQVSLGSWSPSSPSVSSSREWHLLHTHPSIQVRETRPHALELYINEEFQKNKKNVSFCFIRLFNVLINFVHAFSRWSVKDLFCCLLQLHAPLLARPEPPGDCWGLHVLL